MRPGSIVRVSLAVLAVACGGYGSDSTGPTPAISIQANPTMIALSPGQRGDVTIVLTRTNYTGVVELVAEGNTPDGASLSFSGAPIPNERTTATVRITVAATAAPGSGTLTIRARGGGVTDQT